MSRMSNFVSHVRSSLKAVEEASAKRKQQGLGGGPGSPQDQSFRRLDPGYKTGKTVAASRARTEKMRGSFKKEGYSKKTKPTETPSYSGGMKTLS